MMWWLPLTRATLKPVLYLIAVARNAFAQGDVPRPVPCCVPPQVGQLGWLGVRLDRNLGWHEDRGLVENAVLTFAGSG